MTDSCECGCGGWVPPDTRFMQNHEKRKSPVDFVETETGCWIWQLSGNGRYGQTTRDGRSVFAHRAYYVDLVGPIPEGKQLDHLCRNTLCVNPGHLEPVTPAENVRRGRVKNHSTCRSGLHPWTQENIRTDSRGVDRCYECMRLGWRRRRARAKARREAPTLRKARILQAFNALSEGIAFDFPRAEPQQLVFNGRRAGW